jgi:hypothetical protein
MTGEPGAKGAPYPSTDERAQGQDVLGLGERERDYLLAWVGENLTLVRRSASSQRVFTGSSGSGFVVGLAAHAGGFLLKTSATTEPLLMVADLLYALGWALWTSVVVVVFVQIWPEAKKRQYKQALDAYEAAVGRQARVGSGQAADAAGAGEAVRCYRNDGQQLDLGDGRHHPRGHPVRRHRPRRHHGRGSPGRPVRELDVKAAKQANIEFADGKLLVKHPKLRTAFTTKFGSVVVLVELPTGSDVEGDTAKGEYLVEGAGRLVPPEDPHWGPPRVEEVSGVRLRTPAAR